MSAMSTRFRSRLGSAIVAVTLSMLPMLNAERASEGLPPLTEDAALTARATAWSQVMAEEERAFHSPGAVRENVGRGPSVSSIHAALMSSPGHRAHIMNPEHTRVGIGIVERDGTIYITQLFERAPAPPPPPKPEPKPEPPPPPKEEPRYHDIIDRPIGMDRLLHMLRRTA